MASAALLKRATKRIKIQKNKLLPQAHTRTKKRARVCLRKAAEIKNVNALVKAKIV